MSLRLDWGTNNETYKKGGSRHGTCMCMSVDWLYHCLKINNKLASRASMSNILAIGAMHVIHSRKQAEIDKDTSLTFDERVGLWHERICEHKELNAARFSHGNNQLSMHPPTVNGAYLLTIYGNGGHTMAIYKRGNTRAFFDPNSGQHSARTALGRRQFSKPVENRVWGDYPDLRGNWFIYSVTL